MYQTNRLKFSPLNSISFEDVRELFCENHLVMKMTLKGRVFTSEEFDVLSKKEFVQSTTDKIGFWCLSSLSDNQFIGVSGLLKCNYLTVDNYEFGFILKEQYWRQGLATEIGNFWFDFAKNQLNLSEIIATVSPDNLASLKVMEKLEMEFVEEIESNDRGARLVFIKKL